MEKFEKICGVCSRRFSNERDYLDGTDQWRVCSRGSLWFNCSCQSTLMIPKGKFDWYSPSKVMSAHARSLFNQMSNNRDLPHIPSAVLLLRQKLEDPGYDVGDLAKAVRADPFITAEVLKLCANRRNFESKAGGEDQTSLSYAIAFIGCNELKNLVLLASMRQFTFKTLVFDANSFWSDAFKTANIAEYLWAKVFGRQGKDRAFLAGCLCNVGKLVAAIIYPNETDKICRDLQDPKTQNTWEKLESLRSIPSHVTLGEVGAAFWGFPKFISEAIRNHHAPLPEDHLEDPDLCQTVALSNSLLHWIKLEPHRIDEALLEKNRIYLKIKKSLLNEYISEMTKIVNQAQKHYADK